MGFIIEKQPARVFKGYYGLFKTDLMLPGVLKVLF
jgi:hypothetical protein